MKRAPPSKIRNANINSLKEALFNKSYKTSQEVIDGSKVALGIIFENFTILDSGVAFKDEHWRASFLDRRLISRANIIEVYFGLEIEPSNIEYYLKFFSRKEFSEKYLIRSKKDLSEKLNPSDLTWIIRDSNFFDRGTIRISLTHKEHKEYIIVFSMALKEYPELAGKITRYIELSGNKENNEIEVNRFKNSFRENNLDAALFSNVKCCQLKDRIDRITKLMDKLIAERSKAIAEREAIKSSLIEEFISSDIQMIESRITQEEHFERRSLKNEIFN